MASVVLKGNNDQTSHISQQISELIITQKQLAQQLSSFEHKFLRLENEIQAINQRLITLEPKYKSSDLIKHNLNPDANLYTQFRHAPSQQVKKRAELLIELYGKCDVMEVQVLFVSQLDLLRTFFTKNILCPVVTVDELEPYPIASPDCPFHSLDLGKSLLLPYNEEFYAKLMNNDLSALFKI